MRYETAIELARRLIEHDAVDSSRFEWEQYDATLADHNDYEYSLHYKPDTRHIPHDLMEAVVEEDITIKPMSKQGDLRFALEWTDVDDVFSYTGRLSQYQRRPRVIDGTIRRSTQDDHVLATLNTAENGTVRRVEIEAERTGNHYRGVESTCLTYRQYRDGDLRTEYSEELVTEQSPDEIIQQWLPDDEDLPHQLYEAMRDEDKNPEEPCDVSA